MTHRIRRISIALLLLCISAPAHAAWFDSAWPFRRSIDVTWDHEKTSGEDIAQVEFYTAGHHKPDGSDIRVATEQGKLVPSKVMMIGPGDKVRVVFSLMKGVREYFVYFGHENPPPPPEIAADVPIRKGLLLEMRNLENRHANNFDEIVKAWDDSKQVIGRAIVAEPFVGYNPFGQQDFTISKYTGRLTAASDGEYTFAGAADDRGALWIDGKQLLFIPNLVGDIRYNAKLNLSRGQHEFVFYHVNGGGDGRFTIAWKRPDSAQVERIPPQSFGICFKGVPGPLEEIRKTLTADFKVEYLGECFYNNHYSHRYKFTAHAPKASAAVSYEWDLGDGQTHSGKEFDHVYLADGVYNVRLTMKIGNNSDTQTTGILVGRDLEKIVQPPTDEPPVQSKIVATYDVSKMPLNWLAWAAWLHLKAGAIDPMLKVLERTASVPTLPDPGPVVGVMREGTRDAFIKGKGNAAMAFWDKIPKDSNLQPRAVKRQALYLIWWTADFEKALKVLQPFVSAADTEQDPEDDSNLQRFYGQALILAGKAEEGAKILREMPGEGKADRQAVISGAMARTVEHYIEEGDWESGEQAWEKWQSKYPADFLEGYSVLLRTRLMELRKSNDAAAKVAEAFATAMPNSSYAPQLLDKASKLLASSDGKKSEALRELLKKRYPEDPLAQ